MEKEAVSQTEKTKTESSNTVYAIEEVSVYTKPNIESDIKYTAKAGVGFTLIRETKFCLCELHNSKCKNSKGYILLDKLKSK